MASSHYFSKAIHHEVNDVDIQYEVNDMDNNSPIFQELDKLMIKLIWKNQEITTIKF